MKKIIAIIFLVSCAFGSTIYTQIFPEDIYGQAYIFVLIFEVLMVMFSLLSFFLIQNVLNNKNLKILAVVTTGLICFLINLNILPTEYGPKHFLVDSSAILENYEKITLNDFKDSYRTKDVMMNNSVLEKFDLNQNLYHVTYLDISESNAFPKTIEEFPIWIEGNKVIHDNNSITIKMDKDVFAFTDDQYLDTIKFLIAKDGLNKVENFYTGGGTNQNNIRESGTIDQKGIRIVVSISNPKLEVDNSYGKLMRHLIKITK